MSTLRERIAERTAIADDQLQYQGFFGRAMNRIGLAAANVTDTVIAPFNTSASAFLGGAVMGSLRGATLGLVGGAALLALGVIPSMLPAIAVGAAAFALYHGVKAARYHVAHDDDTRLADRIAERFGAVPEQARGASEPEPSVASPPVNTGPSAATQDNQQDMNFRLREEQRRLLDSRFREGHHHHREHSI